MTIQYETAVQISAVDVKNSDICPTLIDLTMDESPHSPAKMCDALVTDQASTFGNGNMVSLCRCSLSVLL